MRNALLVIHPTRPEAVDFAKELILALRAVGISSTTNYLGGLPESEGMTATRDFEIAIVLGGDGTILRAAELVLGTDIPILGINLGNVGFLAEINRPTAEELAAAVAAQDYRGESRLLLRHEVRRGAEVIASGWALNEFTIERSHSQMVAVFVQIDDRPLSRWGCDGVICATPTGSTAYAFSAGGPVLWPEVEAIVVLPLAAHALFSRPMVISPASTVVIDIESPEAMVTADGMRKIPLLSGDRVFISKSPQRVEILHVESAVFTDRLVAKFRLPIEGWRSE
ncbi:MAG: NAD kinase [Actinomycetes bacterium]